MQWKQPIPTNLEEIFGNDHISRLLYIEILLKCSNKDRPVNRNGKITKISRGQCYFTITSLADRLGRNRKTIRKYLEMLKNVYNVVDNDIDRFGVVVTVNDYDEIVSMDNDLDNERTTSGQRVPINKNVKNEKNEKKYILEGREVVGVRELVRILVTFTNNQFKGKEEVTDNKITKTLQRLKSYSADELAEAIRRASKNPRYRGENDINWKFSYGWLVRSDDNVDKVLT